LCAVAGVIVSILWTLALWDSYRPKITVTPGGTLNPKSPFATYFIVQNQGALSISNIRYLTRLEPLPALGTTNHFLQTEQSVSIIPQMRSLESYGLPITYNSVQINTNSTPATTNQAPATTQFSIAALLLTFEISYNPQWYFKRVETFHFTGVCGTDGIWQWIPSAHQSITETTIDTNLLTQIQKMNSVPIATPTNGGTQAHTNQVKPH
jgi:hypothetical protein